MVIFRGGADSQGSNVWSRASALIPGQSAFLVASRRGVQLWTKNWGDMPAETASVDQGVVMFGQTTEYFKCYSFAAKMEFLN